MMTPDFWRSRNLISTLLLPASMFYELTIRLRQAFARAPVSLSVPLICIGNLTAGGAGKTPVAIYIGERLKQKNIPAYFLSRGYGGRAAGPLLVNPQIHTAREVGDEPLLLARTLPTVIAKDRLRGASFAMERGARVIIMDDGFQNPTLAKALSLLVVDGNYGFGNGRLLPAGPLREPPEEGFERAQSIVVIDRSDITPEFPSSLPVLQATVVPSAEAAALKGKNLLAFCGIAFPQKFYSTLSSLGAHVIDTVSFPDHYLYRGHDIKKLATRAKRERAILVTTAKDAVRLSAEWKSLVTVVDITIRLDQPDVLDSLINNAVIKQTW